MKIYAMTDKGRVRKNNEDSFFATVSKTGMFDAVLVIADGMGGHSFGEVASGTCVESFLKYIQSAPLDNPAHVMREAVFMANYAVCQESKNRQSTGMGTTLVAAGIIGSTAYIVNIGDSRLYLLNEKENSMIQVTRDHSYVEEQIRKGLMKRGSEEYYRARNVITRAIGFYPDIEADQFEIDLQEGDYLLLCSDGLSNMLHDVVIKNLALDSDFDLKSRVEILVNAANNNGGKDNISVILAAYEVNE